MDLVTEHSRLQVQVRIIKGLTLQQQQERQSMRLRPDVGEVFSCSPVVRLAAADVARFDVDGCLLCHNACLFVSLTMGY